MGFQYYNDIADGYDELYEEEQLAKLRELSFLIDFSSFKKVLDVGAGTLVAADFFDKEKYFAVEPARRLIENSKRTIGEGKVLVASAEELRNLFEEKFDLVLCLTSAHHFENPGLAFKNINALTFDGGKVVFSLLKNASSTLFFKELLEEYFEVEEEFDGEKDVFFICSKGKIFI